MAKSPDLTFIVGIGADGRAFRPSDWAERLAGAVGPALLAPAAQGSGRHPGYSRLCFPCVHEGHRSVALHPDLQRGFAHVWDFLLGFGRDNGLTVRFAGVGPQPDPSPVLNACPELVTSGTEAAQPDGASPSSFGEAAAGIAA